MKAMGRRVFKGLLVGLVLLGGCSAKSTAVKDEGMPAEVGVAEPSAEKAAAEVTKASAEASVAGFGGQEAADWVLSQSEKALGSDKLRDVKSRRQRTTSVLPGQGITLNGEALWLAPDKLFMKENMPGLGDMLMAYDGEGGWAQDPIMGLRRLEGIELEQLRQATLAAEMDASLVFPTRTFIKVETVDDRLAYKLEFIPTQGEAVHRWIDAETFYPLKQRQVAESAQGRVRMTLTFGDWREVNGIKVPYLVETKMGPMRMNVRIVDIEYDVPVDEAIFAYPSAE